MKQSQEGAETEREWMEEKDGEINQEQGRRGGGGEKFICDLM